MRHGEMSPEDPFVLLDAVIARARDVKSPRTKVHSILILRAANILI